MATKSVVYPIPYGSTEPYDFLLKNNGSAIDGTGFSVGLSIERKDGASISNTPTVTWLSQSAGTVRVTFPGVLAVGSYLVRFTLTDGNGKVGKVPNGDVSDIWQVVTP